LYIYRSIPRGSLTFDLRNSKSVELGNRSFLYYLAEFEAIAITIHDVSSRCH